jgi:Spy/CpxP family protein refolding chaperone
MKRKMKIISAACILCLLISAPFSSLIAQQPNPLAQQPDPLGGNFFPPELIMQTQQAIGLVEEQKTYIMSQIQEAQETFTKLNWSLQKEMETLIKLTSQNTADEKKVVEQLDKVLQIEEQVKKTQITLMVRIKNKLTTEQQAKLKQIKEQQSKQRQ